MGVGGMAACTKPPAGIMPGKGWIMPYVMGMGFCWASRRWFGLGCLMVLDDEAAAPGAPASPRPPPRPGSTARILIGRRTSVCRAREEGTGVLERARACANEARHAHTVVRRRAHGRLAGGRGGASVAYSGRQPALAIAPDLGRRRLGAVPGALAPVLEPPVPDFDGEKDARSPTRRQGAVAALALDAMSQSGARTAAAAARARGSSRARRLAPAR